MDMGVVFSKLLRLGQDMREDVLDFFQNGKLLKLINSTIIALIPKVDAPEYAN